MNTPLKPAVIVPFLASYLFVSCLVIVIPVSDRLRRAIRIRITSSFSRIALALLGLRIRVNGNTPLRPDHGGCLIVSNHLSYLDILIISSLVPSVFITSVELKRTPVLGVLARLGGSLFVERRSPSGLKREIEAISLVLAEGFPVVLFPEGTTSNGEDVQQFKNSLFDAAVLSGSDIFPLCLRYTKLNGKPITDANRDAVFYYGEMTFIRHLPRLLSQKSVEVDVTPLVTITAHAAVSRKELAKRAHEAISWAYRMEQEAG